MKFFFGRGSHAFQGEGKRDQYSLKEYKGGAIEKGFSGTFY